MLYALLVAYIGENMFVHRNAASVLGGDVQAALSHYVE